MTTPSSPWPEGFTTRRGLDPWAVFILVGLITAILPSLNIYLASRSGTYADPAVFRGWVTVLVNSAAIGFALAYVIWAVRRVRRDLLAASELFATDDPETFVAAIVARPGGGALAVGLATGLAVYAVLNIEYFDTFDILTGEAPLIMLYAWFAPLFLVLWLTLFYSATVLTTMATRLGKAASASLRVDLLDTTPLAAVPAIGIRLTLIAVIGLVSLPIQQVLVGDLEPQDWVPPMILVLGFGSWTVLRPIFGTHAAIVRAKAVELARIDAALALPAPAGDEPAAAEDRERSIEQLASARFANLLQWREHVDAVSEWPLSRSSRGRLFFYLVIPPLAWLAAAFTEALVEASL